MFANLNSAHVVIATLAVLWLASVVMLWPSASEPPLGELEQGVHIGSSWIKETFLAGVSKAELPNYTHTSSAESRLCLNIGAFNHQLQRSSPWRVFSQLEQDYAIDALFRHVGVTNRFFVEFGAPQRVKPWKPGKNADEMSNTKMFQVLHGWKGLLMDGGYKRPDINLQQEFITRENIVQLLDKYHVPKEVDFVSIDIDSCDLWVFYAMTATFRPRVIIAESSPFYKPDDASTLSCGVGDTSSELPSEFATKGAAETGGWSDWFFTDHGLYSAGAKAFRLAARARGYTPVWLEPHFCEDIILVRDDLLCDDQAGLDFYQRDFEQLVHKLKCHERDWRGDGVKDGLPYRANYTVDFERWLEEHQ